MIVPRKGGAGMAEIMDLKNAGRADGYRYAVYTHQLVSPDGIAYPRCFIVIKSAYNVIVYFTKLHQFVGVYEGSVYRPLSSDARERMIYITQMLNYIIIDHKPVYRIDHVFRITKDMLLAFFMLPGFSAGYAASTPDILLSAETSCTATKRSLPDMEGSALFPSRISRSRSYRSQRKYSAISRQRCSRS